MLTHWSLGDVNEILDISDRKVHVANMGPIWGWQDPDGAYVGPMNLLSGMLFSS